MFYSVLFVLQTLQIQNKLNQMIFFHTWYIPGWFGMNDIAAPFGVRICWYAISSPFGDITLGSNSVNFNDLSKKITSTDTLN